MVHTAFFFLVVLMLTASTAFAHPGGTAPDGCHTCWTNCERWGVPYGERHCHRGPAPQPSHPIEATPAQYDPYGYNPDLSPSPWAAPQADYWAERRRRTLDDLSRDPLGQPRWPDKPDGYREPSTMACDTMTYNPAAQQRCYERLQAR